MIAIEIKGAEELMRKFDKMRMKQPAKRVCKEIARDLVMNMKSLVPFWHGSLMKSIQSRETKDGYNIHMLFYGKFLETGHRIPAETRIPLLVGWARQKLIWPEMWLKKVEKFGWWVRPQPFIQPSIDQTITNFDNIASYSITSALKESGFK